MKEYQGTLQGAELRVGIVAARFNALITKKLVEGAVEGLALHGVSQDHIALAWVPGSFEIPLAAKNMASSGQYDAVICLGAVIRGATSHFDFVASQVSSGVGQAALETGVPVIFGVLTTDSVDQALERSGVKMGNKGYESAQAAIEMANLLRTLEPSSPSQYSVERGAGLHG